MEKSQKLIHISTENFSSEINKCSNSGNTVSSVKVETKFETPSNFPHEILRTELGNDDSSTDALIKKAEVSGEYNVVGSVSLKKYSVEVCPEFCDSKNKPSSSASLHECTGTVLQNVSYAGQADEKPLDKVEEKPVKTGFGIDQQLWPNYGTTEKQNNNPRRGRRVPFITLSRPDKKCQKSTQDKANISCHFTRDVEHTTEDSGTSLKTNIGNLERIFAPPLIEEHCSSLSSVSKRNCSNLAINEKHPDTINRNTGKPHIHTQLSELNFVSSCSSLSVTLEKASLSWDQEKLSSNTQRKIFKPGYQNSSNEGIPLKKQFDTTNLIHDCSDSQPKTSKLDDLAQIAASVQLVGTCKILENDSCIKSSSLSPSGTTQEMKLLEKRKVVQLIGDKTSVPKEPVFVVGSDLQEIHLENKVADSRKQKSVSDIENDINVSGVDNEIDSLLEVAAQRNKLSRTNVKNILRHVMTNDYVLAMVRNTMKPEDEGDDKGNSGYEPKLTRSKVKELREKKAQLPWLVSSPAKQSNNTGTIKLLQEEFSDRDSTSDEEYKPNEEEEAHSEEEENTFDPSSAETAATSPLQPVKITPRKKQSSELLEEPSLVIAEIPANSVHNAENEADRIALRTRSKLPLNDTPLEAIEASFIAPDITVDMYDTDCDDDEWRKFLCDFAKPLDTKVLEDQPDDDAEDDPEYNFLEEEDVLDDCDVTYDKDLKIPRKELKALMREILEAAEQEFLDFEEEEESDVQPAPSIWFPAKEHVFEKENTFQMLSRNMTDHEKLQLQEQMRMHVQLLCQTYLLSRDNPFFVNFGYCARDMLVELKTLADRELPFGKISSFRAANLEGGVKIVSEFSLDNKVANICEISKARKSHGIRSNKAKKTMAFDRTFIYPDLLPFCSFKKYIETTKPVFTLAEDNLIALGLEQFSEMQRHIHLIHEYLLPTKTEQQIRFRIKNAKSMKYSADHPIRYFFIHGKCPQFQRTVRPFDPRDVKVPAEMPADLMPKWMRPFLIRQYVPLAPILSSSKPKSSVVKPLLLLTPEKRHYSPILPRGSPMKQVIPILRKYGQHRRSIILASPTKRIPRFTKKPTRPPLRITAKRKILPKISNSNNIMQNIKVSCMDNASVEVRCNKKARLDTSGGVRNGTETSEGRENYANESALEMSIPLSEDPGTHDIVAENESQNEMETCEEGEDEALDDEQDLAALMVASSTICKKQQPVVRKKNRHQKDVESTLALLSPDLMESDPKKAEREDFFAQSYLVRVLEALKNDPGRMERFLMTVLKFENKENCVATLFEEMEDILKDHASLLYDFIGFLSAEQANECGKYMEYLTLTKIRSFLRKIEVHFSQQPQQIQKIIRAFSQLNQQADLTSESVIRTLQPLLRNQSHLLEELSQLLPDDHPPESMMTDFEDITIPDSDMDHSSSNSFEDITIPETVDPYGGKDCPCTCHEESSDVRMQNRSRHCAKCGTKFLDGRVYIQTGKVLKPAQVIYHTTVELLSDSQKQSTLSTVTSRTSSKTSREVDSPLSSPTYSPRPSQCIDTVQQQLAENSKVTSSKQTSGLGPNPVCARKSSNLIQTPSVTSSFHTSSGCHLVSKSPSPEKTLQRALEDHLDDVSVPTLQCPVIEDAVLPPDSSNRLSSVPSDFSHLKDVIRSSSHSPKTNAVDYPIVGEVTVASTVSSCESCFDPLNCYINSEKQKNDSSKVKSQSSSIPSGDVFLSGQQADTAKEGSLLGSKTACHSPSVPCETSGTKWTRNEDSIILSTCKEQGLCEETFSIISQSITDKNIHQIKSRLEELLQLFRKKVKTNADAESPE